MGDNKIELINTGILDQKYAKNATHCFCAAIEHECRKWETEDLKAGYNMVYHNLEAYSREHSETHGINPVVRFDDDLLEYFFNQKREIPGYVYFWFVQYYEKYFGMPSKYKGRHFKTYNALQREYIKQYRTHKYYEKEDAQIEKEMRRIVSNAFRSGRYDATFKLYNKDLSEYIDKKEVDALSVVLPRLFSSQLFDDSGVTEIAARAFITGRMQGRLEVMADKNIM